MNAFSDNPNIKLFQATVKDDEQLRSLMRSTPMPGAIEMLYAREPNYFYGLDIQGKSNKIGACSLNGRIVAAGCRSIRPVYINGVRTDFGYLNCLRVLDEHRGGRTIDIFRTLKEFHKDGLTKGYLNTIIEDNAHAYSALASGRPEMPVYTDLGKYVCYAVSINRRRKQQAKPGLEIITGEEAGINEIVEFMNMEGRKKQFFPVYTPQDFSSTYTRGFNADDFYVARKAGMIAGVIGKWDQSAFKQNIITGYNGMMRFIKPVLNPLLRLSGYEPLPSALDKIKMFYASFTCIKDNDPDILEALIERLYADNRNSGYHYFLLGLHETDKLRKAMDKFFSIKYSSRIYLVTYEEDREIIDSMNKSMTSFLEAATL